MPMLKERMQLALGSSKTPPKDKKKEAARKKRRAAKAKEDREEMKRKMMNGDMMSIRSDRFGEPMPPCQQR